MDRIIDLQVYFLETLRILIAATIYIYIYPFASPLRRFLFSRGRIISAPSSVLSPFPYLVLSFVIEHHRSRDEEVKVTKKRDETKKNLCRRRPREEREFIGASVLFYFLFSFLLLYFAFIVPGSYQFVVTSLIRICIYICIRMYTRVYTCICI